MTAMTSSPSSAVPAAAIRQTIGRLRVGLLVIAAVISLLGLSLFVFSFKTDTLFAWTIKARLNAALLGA